MGKWTDGQDVTIDRNILIDLDRAKSVAPVNKYHNLNQTIRL